MKTFKITKNSQYIQSINLDKGTYTYSCNVKSDATILTIAFQNTMGVWTDFEIPILSGMWNKKAKLTFDLKEKMVNFDLCKYASNESKVYVQVPMLEEGTNASTPKSNDLDDLEEIDNNKSQIKAFNQTFEDLENYIDGAFKDGVIDSAEAKAIEKYKNTINEAMARAEASYLKVYNNSYLEDTAFNTPKSDLLDAKINLWGQRETLLSTIDTAIADGKTTVAEKNAVDSAFSTFNDLMSDFQSALEEANKAIQNKINQNAKDLVTVKDTRNDNQPPAWYYANYPFMTAKELKLCSVIGITGESTLCTLESVVRGADSSGGAVIQTATTDSGKQFVRSGAVGWTQWRSDQISIEHIEAITDNFTTSQGGLFTPVTIALREAETYDVTAGMSGIQGDNEEKPAFWAGGDYNSAKLFRDLLDAVKNGTELPKEKMANYTVLHDGSVRMGKFIFDVYGNTSMIDPISGRKIITFTDGKIPTVWYSMGDASDNREIENDPKILKSSDGVFVHRLPQTLPIPFEGGKIKVTMTVTFSALFVNGGYSRAHINLLRNGQFYENVYHRYKAFPNTGTGDDYSITEPIVFELEDIPSGDYSLELSIYPFFTAPTTLSISKSTMRWDFIGADDNIIKLGENGFMARYGNRLFHYTNEEGLTVKGAVNLPKEPRRYLCGGSVSDTGGVNHIFGSEEFDATFTPTLGGTGTYVIAYNSGLGVAPNFIDDYIVILTPNTAGVTMSVSGKSRNGFTVTVRDSTGLAANAAFDFTIFT